MSVSVICLRAVSFAAVLASAASPLLADPCGIALQMTRGRPGEVRPEGWIRDWARTAAGGYTGHLDDCHDEFRRAWTAEHRPRGAALDWMSAPEGSWSAEGGAYWFDGLVRLAWQLDDPVLKALAGRKLEPLLANMNPKSVLFNWWLNRDNAEERGWVYRKPAIWQMWAAGISERPLEAWYSVTGDRRALKALEWAFDDPRLFTEATVRKAPTAAAVIEAARLTGAAGVRVSAAAAAADPMPRFQVPPEEGLADSLHLKRYDDKGRHSGTRHGVTTAEGLLSVLRAYEVTGRRELLDSVLAWFDFLDRHAMQPYGVMVSDEEWGWAGADRSSETCTVAAEPWTRTELMMVLGEGRWGDQVERAFFNAAPNCVSRDFMRHVYLQPANRTNDACFACSSAYKDFVGLKQNPTRYEETHYPLCCLAALNRLIPNYIQSMWMKSADGGVTAALYGPSTFATDLPSGRFSIREDTAYPFEETVRLTVTEAPSGELPLRLRLPSWCEGVSLEVNGTSVAICPDRGFASVRRIWKSGDRIVLRLPMRPRLHEMRDNNRGGLLHRYVTMGPLLFAWCPPARDENTPNGAIREPVLDGRALEDAQVVRYEMPSRWDWPAAAPVRLNVRDADGRQIELVPYGCAPLRVSLFRGRREATARFMTFNVRMGCGHDDPFELPKGSLGHLPQCAAVIREANPDFVAIQEIDCGTDRAGGVDQTAELARLCGLHGTFVAKTPRPGGQYGLALLSRKKPLSVEKVLMPGKIHTRCLMICEFDDCIVANTHFPLSDEKCREAAEIVCRTLRGKTKPVVLMGDLNSDPDAQAIAVLKREFRILSDPAVRTWPAKCPDRTIDYVMIDRAHADSAVVDRLSVVAAPEATDHCAIVLTIRH